MFVRLKWFLSVENYDSKCFEKRSSPSSIRRFMNQHFQLTSTSPPVSIALLTPARANVLGQVNPARRTSL